VKADPLTAVNANRGLNAAAENAPNSLSESKPAPKTGLAVNKLKQANAQPSPSAVGVLPAPVAPAAVIVAKGGLTSDEAHRGPEKLGPLANRRRPTRRHMEHHSRD
jgi:hypothetical protein